MSLFFDSSTLISLAMTCSLPLVRQLKESYKDNFYITTSVYDETITKALQSLRFRYEGHRLKELISDGVFKIYPDADLSTNINKLMNLINNTYFAYNKPLKIAHLGEISALAACIKEKSEAFAVDEWTARLIVENPDLLLQRFERKFHTKIKIKQNNLSTWEAYVVGKTIPIRSTELAVAGWEKGLLSSNPDVLFGLLWALKFAGCAITEDEINFYSKKQLRTGSYKPSFK